MLSHPIEITYYRSRKLARLECCHGQKVVRLGLFANGSFGVYARQKSNGQYVNGHNPLINVWAVIKRDVTKNDYK